MNGILPAVYVGSVNHDYEAKIIHNKRLLVITDIEFQTIIFQKPQRTRKTNKFTLENDPLFN